MGGFRAVRDIRVVCTRRRDKATDGAVGAAGTSAPAWRRVGDSGTEGRGGGRELRGVAGLAAFRASLGELVIGPWRKDTPTTFGTIKNIRAVEVSSLKESLDSDIVDLSLEWDLEQQHGGLAGAAGGASDAASPWATLHCDVWRVTSGEKALGWRWLGRAYGRKYRLRGLRSWGGADDEPIVLAVQQVNAMGYREVSLAGGTAE